MGGWAVRVTMPNGPSQVIYARLAERLVAEEAVRRMVGREAGATFEAFEWVDDAVFDDMNITDGRVGQWR